MKKKFYNTKDSYKEYESISNNPVDISTYIHIINGLMKFIVKRLFKTGEILFPERLGKLLIVGKKVKVILEDGKIRGLAPDWGNTKKLWKEDLEAKKNKQLVFHFNEHTDSIRYRFSWSKARALVPNKTLYNIRMTRDNKRALAKIVKQGKEYLIR